MQLQNRLPQKAYNKPAEHWGISKVFIKKSNKKTRANRYDPRRVNTSYHLEERQPRNIRYENNQICKKQGDNQFLFICFFLKEEKKGQNKQGNNDKKTKIMSINEANRTAHILEGIKVF
jgi:hypothetical protein